MSPKLKVLSFTGLVLFLAGCGNPSSRGTGFSTRNQGVGMLSGGSTRNASSLFLGSGNMGSPNGAAPGSTGTPAAQPATTPTLNSNPFARNSITTASDPQQCANVYNSYARFEGNFERALFDLTTCLNQVMVRQNPRLFQQYQNLYQYQQYPQLGWGGPQ